MRRLGRTAHLLLLGLLLAGGGGGATEPSRTHLLREQLQQLEALPSRTPAQEQQAEQLRAALKYSALEEQLSGLGVQFHAGRVACPAEGVGCTVQQLMLSGRATAEEVEAKLRRAGYHVTPGAVFVQGPPQIAPVPKPPPTLPLTVRPVHGYVQFAGEPLRLQIELSNSSAQPISAGWGMDILSAVLLDGSGEVVTWHHPYVTSLAGLGASCPARQPCTTSPELSLPLTRYGTNEPLPSGRYRLRVRVTSLRVGEEAAVSFTLPDRPIAVEAPNAR